MADNYMRQPQNKVFTLDLHKILEWRRTVESAFELKQSALHDISTPSEADVKKGAQTKLLASAPPEEGASPRRQRAFGHSCFAAPSAHRLTTWERCARS